MSQPNVSQQITLSSNGSAPQYARSLQQLLMLVFANSQLELDESEMRAIRDVIDLTIQLQSAGEGVSQPKEEIK